MKNLYGRKKLNRYLLDAFSYLVCKEHYFLSEYCANINWIKNNSIPTMGVTIKGTYLMCYYNEEFVEKHIKDDTLTAVIIHEILHLLYDHPHRASKIGNLNHEYANWAMDMIINDIIDSCYTEFKLPKEALRTPKEYNGEPIFEELYMWILEQQQKWKDEKEKNGEDSSDLDRLKDIIKDHNNQNGQSNQNEEKSEEKSDKDSNSDPDNSKQQNSDESNSDSKDQNKYRDPKLSDYMRKLFDRKQKGEKIILDEHLLSQLSDKERADLKRIVDETNNQLRTRGLLNGNEEDIIKRLKISRRDYLKEIKKCINFIVGVGNNNHKTFVKRNRRNITGIKGKRKSRPIINILLDTSGSMSGVFDKILGVIKDDAEIHLVQCDTEVQDYKKISSKHQVSTLSIKGLGGTVLQPGIDFLAEKGLKYNTCVLTDGYTDTLNFSKLNGKKILIITTDVECEIAGTNTNITQIKIDVNDM